MGRSDRIIKNIVITRSTKMVVGMPAIMGNVLYCDWASPSISSISLIISLIKLRKNAKTAALQVTDMLWWKDNSAKINTTPTKLDIIIFPMIGERLKTIS